MTEDIPLFEALEASGFCKVEDNGDIAIFIGEPARECKTCTHCEWELCKPDKLGLCAVTGEAVRITKKGCDKWEAA